MRKMGKDILRLDFKGTIDEIVEFTQEFAGYGKTEIHVLDKCIRFLSHGFFRGFEIEDTIIVALLNIWKIEFGTGFGYAADHAIDGGGIMGIRGEG